MKKLILCLALIASPVFAQEDPEIKLKLSKLKNIIDTQVSLALAQEKAREAAAEVNAQLPKPPAPEPAK